MTSAKPGFQSGSNQLSDNVRRVEAIPTSLRQIENNITPVDHFFVRSHFDEPQLSMRNWKLSIGGRVAHPLELTFSDLIESPVKKIEAVLECAGNWRLLVSNGVWEGVPMSYLLERAAPDPDASRVLLEGADSGRLSRGRGNFAFTRTVPLQQCMAPETLVAFKLNDYFLPRRNGFPARALLPGWYSMDSVKWLQRIVVLNEEDRPDGFYSSGMESLYRQWFAYEGKARPGPRVSHIRVSSLVGSPAPGARLPAGRHSVWGFAWAGRKRVNKVEFSHDGGRTWEQARLESESRPFTWVRWSYDWKTSKGDHVLMSRAQDEDGNRQPLERESARLDGYELNFCKRVNCSVA